ncbi:hypothetical protein BDV41DRAFT_578457 [Aspergillus transmontanensis]|uniref:Uncharacterized protein n=1 Tax=Aspergillus transmontanensis TaxID=1034304 RepID=A0A5N6VSH8_9EURO|nr:hypothetical protein BDV41DRAFT_578457 [Aspergillus transmontanensis]
MKKLVDQHHRQFTNILSLSISWKDYNTNASRDIKNFQAILRLLDYPKAEEYVVSVDADKPGWGQTVLCDQTPSSPRQSKALLFGWKWDADMQGLQGTDRLEDQGITEQLNWRTFKTMTIESYRRSLNNDRINRL